MVVMTVFPVYTGINRFAIRIQVEKKGVPCIHRDKPQPYQQRVIAERDELSGKLAKLTEFINSDRFTEIVPDERERDRLILQKSIMTAYLDVLNYRIDAFK